MTATTESQDLARLRAAQAWYDREIAPCPRSAEWKAGARAGAWRAHGLRPMPSPWASASVQDDARNAGYHAALSMACHDLARAAQKAAA